MFGDIVAVSQYFPKCRRRVFGAYFFPVSFVPIIRVTRFLLLFATHGLYNICKNVDHKNTGFLYVSEKYREIGNKSDIIDCMWRVIGRKPSWLSIGTLLEALDPGLASLT